MSTSKKTATRKSASTRTRSLRTPNVPHGQFDRIALVLQGGGALGSYQCGVVEGLMEKNIEPDWVAGISIGAINSALIAGNAPAERLEKIRGFWETICQPAVPYLSADLLRQMVEWGGDETRRLFSGFEAVRTMIEGKKGFFVPRGPTAWLGLSSHIEDASFYSISDLKVTLERFVDFDRINHGDMRVSVGAVDVESGDFEFFDNQEGPCQQHLRPEHFMASGALPPGFPPVEINGRYYWDGGLVSNTPLSRIVEGARAHSTLVFQVDLWSATGPLPKSIYDAQERMKDIQYSSRTRTITDSMRKDQKNRRLLKDLLALIPESVKRQHDVCQMAEKLASTHQYGVIHLVYSDKSWEGHSKDYEFSQLTMLDHWSSGLADARQALSNESWLLLPEDGREFVTHRVKSKH